MAGLALSASVCAVSLRVGTLRSVTVSFFYEIPTNLVATTAVGDYKLALVSVVARVVGIQHRAGIR